MPTNPTITERELKHTPGPWETDKSEFSRHVFAHGNDMMVCEIRGWGHLTGVGGLSLSEDAAMAVQNANANLIAAAPDLLEAAKATLEYWESTGFADCDEGCDCIVEATRNAIAKADGRTL